MVSHAGVDVSLSFVKNTGNSSLRRDAVKGVRRPFVDDLCRIGVGVLSACADCAWRNEGVQENLGIFDGDASSLMRSSEGVCLEDLGPEVLRGLGVRDSPAKEVQRETLRALDWPL